MISPDLITRLSRTHNKAVETMQMWAVAKSEIEKERRWAAYDRAEARFESAMSAVVESAKK